MNVSYKFYFYIVATSRDSLFLFEIITIAK